MIFLSIDSVLHENQQASNDARNADHVQPNLLSIHVVPVSVHKHKFFCIPVLAVQPPL
jgi:hypothetical protein